MSRKTDEQLRSALQRLGAKRVEATLLSSLAADGAKGTKDIVDDTGLRQPEVSVGMQVLRDRGWVDAEPVPRQGKGRPMHRYLLVAKPADVRRYYQERGEAAIKEYQDAIKALKKGLS